MCQCVVCDCWWCNCFTCQGFAEAYCCFGFWCCNPATFPPEASKCCFCCQKIGLGGNFFCTGGVCCSPDWLVKWSKTQK